jgi:hypothetical protein
MSRRILLTLLFSLTLTGSGCFSSKWAMRDPDYARKYGKPYPTSKRDKWHRMGKQVIDARHLEDQGGVFAKGAYSENPIAGLMEAGAFWYGRPWVSLHAGLSVLLGEHDIVGFPGLDLGLRFQSPSRFAPFVGAGIYSDVSEAVFGDHDDEFEFEELHEHDRHRDVFAAVYPEAGFHYWLTSGLRLTGSAGYYFSSGGRDQDFLMLGLTFGYMPLPKREEIPEILKQDCTAEELQHLNTVENTALDETVGRQAPPHREASFREMFSGSAPPADDSIKINIE